ncbi:MAG: DUF2231 domain-containing protein [Pseudomonadota bacterium]
MHVILIYAALPLFLGALMSDWAYSASYQVQWKNFAAWLNAGGLVFLGLALLWAVIDRLRGSDPRASSGRYLAALVVASGIGLVNALIHAKDAWAAMPAGLWLSVVALLVLLVAGVLGWPGVRREGAR